MDINIFRNKHDNENEWELKKSFLSAHMNSLPVDQLECLTNCYSNVKLYGCTYPTEVMLKLQDLETKIPKLETKKINKFQNDAKTNLKKLTAKEQKQKKITKCIENRKNEQPKEITQLEERFSHLKLHLTKVNRKHGQNKNKIEILMMACDKAQCKVHLAEAPMDGKFTCALSIDSVYIATGKYTNKKSAKLLAFEEAVNIILMSHHNIVKTASNYQLFGSIKLTPPPPLDNQCVAPFHHTGQGNEKPQTNAQLLSTYLSEFVLREFQYNKDVNLLNQLQICCAFNNAKVKYESTEDEGVFAFEVFIEGMKVAAAKDETKTVAKTKAAEAALEYLKKRCYTLVFKQIFDAEPGVNVEKRDLLDDSNRNTPLPTSNLGNQMLRKLGWTGGGLGKTVGITEPIFPQGVLNREGLGLSAENGLDPNFPAKISAVISDYMCSDKQDDLVFAAEFDKQERMVIHKVSQKYHLTTKSYGREAERFLVLSRKRSPMELVKFVEANDGETYKYLLLRPSN